MEHRSFISPCSLLCFVPLLPQQCDEDWSLSWRQWLKLIAHLIWNWPQNLWKHTNGDKRWTVYWFMEVKMCQGELRSETKTEAGWRCWHCESDVDRLSRSLEEYGCVVFICFVFLCNKYLETILILQGKYICTNSFWETIWRFMKTFFLICL